MDFLQITEHFEEKIRADFKFELLELHYLPYSFGSGTKSYKINGRNIKIVFDGRERLMEIHISNRHEKYTSSNWIKIFNGTTSDFLDKGIEELTVKIKA